MKINICTINHNDTDEKRVIISYDPDTRKLYADGEEIDTPELRTIEAAEDYCAASWGVDPIGAWGLEWMERDEDLPDDIVMISRIDIKSETFCTTWNGKLYCVDICEDSEQRMAWLYNADYGIKSLMFGGKIEDNRDEFLDCVFSNLPEYIADYENDYEDEEV